MAAALALLPVAYLAGTFPTAHLVTRAHGYDITAVGSGNPGASNVYRVLGRAPGALVFAGDIAKGTLPALAGVLLWGPEGGYVLGVAAVLGHVYPVQRRFKGGRGVATAGGMAIALYPLVSAALVVLFFAVSAVTHRASLGSLVVTVALPIGVAVTGSQAWEIAAASAIALLVIARHSANLRRLIHGEELRVDREDREDREGPSDRSRPETRS